MKTPTMVEHKDVFLMKILNSKTLYFILLASVLVYLFGDDKVLNLPDYLWVSKFTFVFVSLSMFVFWRYTKHKRYYERKFKDKVYLVGFVLTVVIFSSIIQGTLNIPINYLIKSNSRNSSVENYYCEITNVVTTNIDKIHFKFRGKVYSRYYNVSHFSRKDLMQNYWLSIQVKKSIWNTYYIEGMKLQSKNAVRRSL